MAVEPGVEVGRGVEGELLLGRRLRDHGLRRDGVGVERVAGRCTPRSRGNFPRVDDANPGVGCTPGLLLRHRCWRSRSGVVAGPPIRLFALLAAIASLWWRGGQSRGRWFGDARRVGGDEGCRRRAGGHGRCTDSEEGDLRFDPVGSVKEGFLLQKIRVHS